MRHTGLHEAAEEIERRCGMTELKRKMTELKLLKAVKQNDCRLHNSKRVF